MAVTVTEEEAKANIERSNKISQLYRDMQELDDLVNKLDSAKAQFDTPEKSAQYRKEINTKIEAQKKKLEKTSNTIKNSKDEKLVAEYNKTLEKEPKLSQYINQGYTTTGKDLKEKTMAKTETKDKSMFDKHTQKKIDDIKSSHSLRRRELALMQREEDPNYEKEKEQFDKEVKWVIEKEYEAKKKAAYSKYKVNSNLAKKETDPAKKEELLTQAENDFDTYEEFKKGQDEVDRITLKKTPMGDDYNVIDASADWSRVSEETGAMITGGESMGSMHDYFANEMEQARAEEEAKPSEDLFAQDKGADFKTQESGSGSSSSSSSKKNTQIETRPERVKTSTDVGAHSGKTYTAKEELEQAKKERELLNDAKIEKYQFQPSDPGTEDPLGNLIDVGRGVAGMIGARTEIPEYKRGSMFSTAMDEAQIRRDEGLSADELNYRNKMAETAYAYNVKNIRRGAGGSAGAYLGNVQSAAAQLYSDYGKTAGVDEEMRRYNRANFQQMALKDEAINRTMFMDELTQATATKEAGAGLVQDAISNIKERRDYNRQYGKDSPYFKYMESLREDTESSAYYRQAGDEQRMKQKVAEADYNVDKAQDKYDKENNLNPEENVAEVVAKQKGETQEAPSKYNALIESELEKAESVSAGEGKTSMKRIPVPPEEVVNAEAPDTRSLNSKNIDAKIEEKRKRMEATDDMDEAMRLDSEIEEMQKMRRKGKGVPINY